jgi:DNA-directed RNA polymerase subunit M/transcription elongation factor TFIIS
MYLIAYCPSCGKLMMANTSNRTRTCPNCGARSKLFHLRVIARVEDSQEATVIIQKLKENRADPDWEPQFIKFKVKEK